MILRTVSRDSVQQQIPDMYLKHLKIIPVHRHYRLNLRTGTVRYGLRQIIPLPSRMTPDSRLLKLDLPQHPVSAEL